MNIVVIGGNGLVGTSIVRRLRTEGHAVTAASRRTGVDIITGKGLDQALVGAHVVVDASNSPIIEGEAPCEFFRVAGENLMAAELRAGVTHHVALSVVGTERLADSPYFRGKAYQERLIRESGLPFTIVHATQFYEFLLQIVELSVYEQTLCLSPAYIQPVASADVAACMAALAARAPLNATIEVAGPDRERLSQIIQRFLTDIEAPYDVVTDRLAPYFGAQLDDESLMPCVDAHICTMGFGAWLNQSEYWGANW